MTRSFALTGLLAVLLLMFGLNQQAVAQQQEIEKPDIRVGVDGMACPFCAYGIEKKLKNIDSIEKLYVNIKEGTVDLKLKKGATLSEERIREAVKKAGFDTRSIKYLNEAAKSKLNPDRSDELF